MCTIIFIIPPIFPGTRRLIRTGTNLYVKLKALIIVIPNHVIVASVKGTG
jgi:hypothetical protein